MKNKKCQEYQQYISSIEKENQLLREDISDITNKSLTVGVIVGYE